MKRQKHFLQLLRLAKCKHFHCWELLKAAKAAAFLIYCSNRDEGVRIFLVIAAPEAINLGTGKPSLFYPDYPVSSRQFATLACCSQPMHINQVRND